MFKNQNPDQIEFQHVLAGHLFIGAIKTITALAVFDLINLILGTHKITAENFVPGYIIIAIATESFASILLYTLQQRYHSTQPGTKWNYFATVLFSLAISLIIAWFASKDINATAVMAIIYPVLSLVEILTMKPWDTDLSRTEVHQKWEETKVMTREHFQSDSDTDSDERY